MKTFFNKSKTLIEEINRAKKYYFEGLTPSKIPEKLQGVYVIRSKKSNKVLYVGRTIDMRRRLYTNHLQGNQSTARLKKYLSEDKHSPCFGCLQKAKKWIKENCYFQYVIEKDYSKRGKIEGLFSFYFDVNYIEKEH